MTSWTIIKQRRECIANLKENATNLLNEKNKYTVMRKIRNIYNI